MVLRSQVRREQHDTREVDGGVREHLEQHGKLPGDSSRAAAALGFVLRQAQLIDAVGGQRVARPLPVSTARVDLGEVCEHDSREAIGAADMTFEAAEQPIVVELPNLVEV